MIKQPDALPFVSRWPVTVKAPALVAIFMITVSLLVSDRVMSRLDEAQERHLRQLSGAYLDGLSSSIQPLVLREDVWEVFDNLDRARLLYAGLDAEQTVVANAANRVIAASHPAVFPTGSVLPADIIAKFAQKPLIIDHAKGKAFALRDIAVQDRSIGSIYTELNIAVLLAERGFIQRTLLLTNGLLIVVLTALAYYAVRRLLGPMKILNANLSQSTDQKITAIADHLLPPAQSEFGHLFRRYNALVDAIGQRERLARLLADEEKLSSLGRLASGVAHEINNPLGGMLNTLDTLARHGDRPSVRTNSIRILERGLKALRHIAQATLQTYNGGQPFLQGDDLEDLRLLLVPYLRRSSVQLKWRNELKEYVDVPAAGLRSAVLNLLLNACDAAGIDGTISFAAEVGDGGLTITIEDNGPGLPPELKHYLEAGDAHGPLEPSRGLGLWMVRRFVVEAHGSIGVEGMAASGTRIGLFIPVQKGELKDVA